jgi:AraC-like DNA-binding protein
MHEPAAGERATFWRDPALGDLELLHATYVRHTFAPHAHEGFAIGVIERGAERFAYRRAAHIAPAGSVVVVNPGEIHTGEAALPDGWRYRMLYPAAEMLQAAAGAVAGRQRGIPFFPAPVVDDPALAAMLIRLHRALAEGVTPLEREARLMWTLAQLVARHADDRPLWSPTPVVPAAVERARDYLHAHAATSVTLRELADYAGLSPFHLLRTFHATVGTAPHAYLTQLRVAQAKTLLRAGLAIAAVAVRTGFTDQSHLTRHFKRIVGVAPGQYARATLG